MIVLIYYTLPIFHQTTCHKLMISEATYFIKRLFLYIFNRPEYELIISAEHDSCIDYDDDPLSFFMLLYTMVMSLSVLFVNPLVNLMYMFGIICGRVHVVLLKDYRIDKMCKDP